MTDVKTGDRVRIFRNPIEGTVQYVSTRHPSEFDYVGPDGLVYTVWRDSETRVEVIVEPVKVGDVVETVKQLDALPAETLIKPLALGKAGLQKSIYGLGWSPANQYGGYRSSDRIALPALVVWLPES